MMMNLYWFIFIHFPNCCSSPICFPFCFPLSVQNYVLDLQILPLSTVIITLLLREWYLGIADDDSSGGLKLGGYEKHEEKLWQERKEEYRKYLAEVRTWFWRSTLVGNYWMVQKKRNFLLYLCPDIGCMLNCEKGHYK